MVVGCNHLLRYLTDSIFVILQVHAGADVSSDDSSPMQLAIQHDHIDCVKLLVGLNYRMEYGYMSGGDNNSTIASY